MSTAMATPNTAASTRTQPATRVRLLADDLTGACDAGVAFLAAGHSVRVWCGARAFYPVRESTQAFHTSSRDLAADQAAKAVAYAARGLERDAHTVLFKKVDSAGRGPIGAEVLAAHRTFGTRAILFAPAFPTMGRTVRNGVLEIRDAGGGSPQVQLAEIFPPEMHAAIAAIARAGDLAPALDSGRTLLLCDSETDVELDALARAAEPLPGLLYAGSAGLARAIANLHAVQASPAPRAAAARILVIAGSPHPVTRLQLARLESAQFSLKRVQILRVQCNSRDEEPDRSAILSAFAAFDPEALILTGGETAQRALEVLGASSILLRGELAPGIPWGVLEGGRAHERIAVTKSGGFGVASALQDLVGKLSGGA